jgi:glycosyltransferase involved in cell wall biosynthesis
VTGPLVTCIMPTRNRRAFAGQAIRYFLRQDYAPAELIVLDNGETAMDDLVPADDRFRYVRVEPGLSLGALRNRACELARGELIAHWDDDDWMAPHRLRLQVGQLLRSGADACGAGELLYYAPLRAEAWSYTPQPGDRPWLAGGTLLYRRALWSRHRFPEIAVGEDSAFVWSLPAERVLALSDRSFYLGVLHGGNTSPKNLADPRWQKRPLDEVAGLLAPDRAFYASLRSGGAPAAGSRPGLRKAASITVAAPFYIYDGYGSMAEYLVLGLDREGAAVHISPLDSDFTGMSEELQAIIRRSRPEPGAPTLYFCWPRPDLDRFAVAHDLFVNTMWESSRIPTEWPTRLNGARAVIVPTRFCAQTFRDSGVTAPLEVVPEGVDPAVYHYEHRPEREGITTLAVGTVVARKHALEAIAAWKLAFAADSHARLIVKARFSYGNWAPEDPRVTLVDTNETTRGIAHWYREADVLLALGSEGCGLPLIEGMATGLPVIALSSEGQGDVCAEAGDRLLAVPPARWEACAEAPFGPCGVRGVPGVEDVAAKLRWVADHQGEARDMGRAASAWAVANRNVWAKAPAVLDVMEARTHPPRALRRVPVVWVPSWGSPCGVAQYAAHLVDAMARRPKVTAAAPELGRVHLLHVQHHDGLFDEVELAGTVLSCRAAGVPVVATEHAVSGCARAWERDADVLVATTEDGTDALRRCWPRKRVVHLPLGCPTWFPPRKRARGRVIGAFGFLESHKGFWALLDLLREVEGSQLLLFSHARSPELEQRWEAAASGLPVRRVREFLPVAEVVRRLAAEADVLAFWYDDVAHAAGSLAVRVGLATGVPVLTSPTRWFADVRGATYQPERLVDGTRRLLDDTELRDAVTTGARHYCHEHSWSRTAERHLALWRELEAT